LTRFYFTKESHIHALYNVIRLCLSPQATEVLELDYLYAHSVLWMMTPRRTQITFEIYERIRGSGSDLPMEYSIRIGFSPGANDAGLVDTQIDERHALCVAPRKYRFDLRVGT
jgi:hypothetical protein